MDVVYVVIQERVQSFDGTSNEVEYVTTDNIKAVDYCHRLLNQRVLKRDINLQQWINGVMVNDYIPFE